MEEKLGQMLSHHRGEPEQYLCIINDCIGDMHMMQKVLCFNAQLCRHAYHKFTKGVDP